MISSDKFIFIHLHKSGGTFVNKMLKKYLASANAEGYHLPYKYIPPEYKHLSVVGTVRNPFDFYISLYFFQKNSQRPNYIFQTFSENGTLSLKDTIKNMLVCKEHHMLALQQGSPVNFGYNGVNLTKRCIAEMHNMDGGWYSRLFQRMYEGAQRITFLKTEDLNNELSNFLLANDCITEEQSLEIINANKVNTSEHDHYSEYYDQELIDIVSEQEKLIIDLNVEPVTINFVEHMTQVNAG